jgi:hypothetical protein
LLVFNFVYLFGSSSIDDRFGDDYHCDAYAGHEGLVRPTPARAENHPLR